MDYVIDTVTNTMTISNLQGSTWSQEYGALRATTFYAVNDFTSSAYDVADNISTTQSTYDVTDLHFISNGGLGGLGMIAGDGFMWVSESTSNAFGLALFDMTIGGSMGVPPDPFTRESLVDFGGSARGMFVTSSISGGHDVSTDYDYYATASPVPEPSGALLFGFAATAGLLRRRVRRGL